MADPANAETRRRAQRFAGFYLNDDPAVPNYDPEHRIVRSPCSGSKGPLLQMRRGEIHYDLTHDHATLGPNFDLPANWWEDPETKRRVEEQFDQVVMQGDVTVNLGVVALVATAFLHTGEARYREWIEEYVGAWIERTEANGGIVPDNIGPNGIVGEMRQGQWWGGLYGWTGRYGHNMMAHSITAAVEAALLVTGEARYLDLLRMHMDALVAHGREEGGRLLVPYKHTDEGWTDFNPINPNAPIHLWAASMEERDWQRLETLRRGSRRRVEAGGAARAALARRPRLDPLSRRRVPGLPRAHLAGQLPRGLRPHRQGHRRRTGSDPTRRTLVAAGQPGGHRSLSAANDWRAADHLLGRIGARAGALFRRRAAATGFAPGRSSLGDRPQR